MKYLWRFVILIYLINVRSISEFKNKKLVDVNENDWENDFVKKHFHRFMHSTSFFEVCVLISQVWLQEIFLFLHKFHHLKIKDFFRNREKFDKIETSTFLVIFERYFWQKNHYMKNETIVKSWLHLNQSSKNSKSFHHIRFLESSFAYYFCIFQERFADMQKSSSKYSVDVDQ